MSGNECSCRDPRCQEEKRHLRWMVGYLGKDREGLKEIIRLLSMGFKHLKKQVSKAELSAN